MAPSSTTLTRQLGRDGPQIPAVGFGLMGMSFGYGETESDEERLKLLDRAWELGCTNWDTADAYGDNEDVIGKWFQRHPERRKDIFLATKFAWVRENGTIDSSPEYCRKAIERSLKRLGVEQIDLYYMHRAKFEVPIEKTVGAMKALVLEGKVKYLGLSEISSNTLRRACAVHPIHAAQMEYNPWTLDVEMESKGSFLKTCKELGVSMFVYSPLGRGILSGRYRSAADFGPGDFRAQMERYQGENFKKNLELADKFAEVAARKGCTSSQLVLAWLLAQEDNIFVIPGTKKIPYLEENFAAAKISITKEEDQELRKLVSEAGVCGKRDETFGAFGDTAPLQ
ncbi:Aldo/keto reductase [Xylariomycetidae sp. FL0641]|nr:Aldo/keto reductase [Xylariomycetidae sp. FL0641]